MTTQVLIKMTQTTLENKKLSLSEWIAENMPVDGNNGGNPNVTKISHVAPITLADAGGSSTTAGADGGKSTKAIQRHYLADLASWQDKFYFGGTIPVLVPVPDSLWWIRHYELEYEGEGEPL